MTVTGLLTSAFHPTSAGAALTRAAARVDAASGPQPAGKNCDCGQSDCPSCGTAATADTVELSPAALAELAEPDRPTAQPQPAQAEGAYEQADDDQDATEPGELTEEEQEQVESLEERDREVRQHEQAHLSAAGSYAIGGPTYEYQQGPDGKRYAIGGEVQIDTSPVEGDPAATIQKMQTVRAAALAPAEPSGQDRAVAAAAAAEIQKAQAELAAQQREGGDEVTASAGPQPEGGARSSEGPGARSSERPGARSSEGPKPDAQRKHRDPFSRPAEVGGLFDAAA